MLKNSFFIPYLLRTKKMGIEVKSIGEDLGLKGFLGEYFSLGVRGTQTVVSGLVSTGSLFMGCVGLYLAITPSDHRMVEGSGWMIGGLIAGGFASSLATKLLGNSTYKKYKQLSQKFEGENILNYFGEYLEQRGENFELITQNSLERKVITLPATDILLINGLEEIKTDDEKYSSFRPTRHISAAQSSFLSRSVDEKKEVCSRILKPYRLLDEENWEDYHKLLVRGITDHSANLFKLMEIVKEVCGILENGNGSKNEKEQYLEIFYGIYSDHRLRAEGSYDREIFPKETKSKA